MHGLVARAFETGDFDGEINNTLLVLILKVEKPVGIKQFRPISLCNVIYKTLSKVLVSQMKPFMEKIIRSLQASFVPGRQAADNIINYCSRACCLLFADDLLLFARADT